MDWWSLEQSSVSRRLSDAVLRAGRKRVCAPCESVPRVLKDVSVGESSYDLRDAVTGLHKRINAALGTEHNRMLTQDSKVSWNFTRAGEDVFCPLALMYERALNVESVTVVDLELVSKEWEESYMRAPEKNERSCSKGEKCWGVLFVDENLLSDTPAGSEGFILARFKTPKGNSFDGMCVICLRAYMTGLFHESMESGVPQHRVVQPYRVKTTEYDVSMCFSRNSHDRFMGFTDPFPMFFKNTFRWCDGKYEQKDMDFRGVAVESLRFLCDPPCRDEPRRLPGSYDEIMECAQEHHDRTDKMIAFGLREMRAFWGIDTGSLFSLALMTDTRRQIQTFGLKHKYQCKSLTKNKWIEMFKVRLAEARKDSYKWSELELVVVNSLHRWGRRRTRTIDYEWCTSHPRFLVACYQEYATYVLEYQGLIGFSHVQFWRKFIEDVRREMDVFVELGDGCLPNYGFPIHSPWYWSFADLVPSYDPADLYPLDARWLFTSEKHFFATLPQHVVDYFKARESVSVSVSESESEASDSDEINRIKNTLRVSFSVLSIRGPKHMNGEIVRDEFLACPKCEEMRTYVVDSRAKVKPRKGKVPITKTMGANKTSYDPQLDRYVCYTKNNPCNFFMCVPIQFGGNYVEFFGSLMVQCPACSRVVRLDPNLSSHGETEWNCGCVQTKTTITCHACGLEQDSKSRRMWKSVIAFGAETGTLYFCKNHGLPPWVENKRAWYYPHFEKVMR